MSEAPVTRGSRPSLLRPILDQRLPEGVGWFHTLGSQLLFLAALQIVTGILLALVYSPSVETAHASVTFIEREVTCGRVVRGLHYFGASAFVILAVLHLIRVFVWGAYKGPRAWLWRTGVVLLLIVLGFGFTGYLLPWDAKGYFGTKVAVAVAASAPGIGGALEKLVQGDAELGALTLTRFYAVHVAVLPLALVSVVALHLFLLERHGITAPWSTRENEQTFPRTSPFFPNHAARDAVAVLVLSGVLVALATYEGAPLEQRADPTTVAYVPHPEWYFLGLQQLLRLLRGPATFVGTMVLPGVFVGLLFLLPTIDRNPVRTPRGRPIALSIFAVLLIVIVGLTAWGAVELQRERAALAARQTERGPPDVIASVESTFKPSEVSRGERLWTGLGCGACHDTASGSGLNLPPTLRYEGSRVQPTWLVAYLRSPYPLRFEEEGVRPTMRMPDFHLTQEEARGLAAYLSERRESARIPAWEPKGPPKVEEGRRTFEQYQCFGCHRIGERGAAIGPDLTHAGSRLTPAFMRAMIMAPARVVPGTAMKDNGLWDEEADNLVAFLMSCR